MMSKTKCLVLQQQQQAHLPRYLEVDIATITGEEAEPTAGMWIRRSPGYGRIGSGVLNSHRLAVSREVAGGDGRETERRPWAM